MTVNINREFFMSHELNIRTIEVPDDFDTSTAYDLIYLTNHLPEQSELNGANYGTIKSTFEEFVGDESNPAAIMIAEQKPSGRAVGYVATHIGNEGQRVAEITQLAVAPQTKGAREIGTLLIKEVESWGEQHEVGVSIPRTIEFTGKVVGREVVEVIPGSRNASAHPSNFLG